MSTKPICPEPRAELEKIGQLAGTLQLSELEQTRLAKDLERIRARLETREYARTDFTGNAFNIPERTAEFFTYLHSYHQAGATWARILKPLNLAEQPRIIDLCSGWAPKIALALFYLDYRGEVILLDRDTKSSEQLVRFMQLFGPRFRLNVQACELKGGRLPSAGLVLANHVLDDFVLSFFAAECGYDTGLLYQAEEALASAWRLILSERQARLERAAEDLCALIDRLVEPGGSIALTQYPAYIEKLLKLDQAVEFCRELLQAITAKLLSQGWSNRSEIAEAALTDYPGYFSGRECTVMERALRRCHASTAPKPR